MDQHIAECLTVQQLILYHLAMCVHLYTLLRMVRNVMSNYSLKLFLKLHRIVSSNYAAQLLLTCVRN